MLSPLRTVNGRFDWGAFAFGRVWPVVFIATVVLILVTEISNPERVREMQVTRCLTAATAGPSITLPCTGAVMDDSLRLFLARPQNAHLEVAAIVPYSESRMFGSAQIRGYTFALREKSH